VCVCACVRERESARARARGSKSEKDREVVGGCKGDGGEREIDCMFKCMQERVYMRVCV